METDHFYANGKLYLLMSDYYSYFRPRQCEELFTVEGTPGEVISHNGLHFNGMELTSLLLALGIKHIIQLPTK